MTIMNLLKSNLADKNILFEVENLMNTQKAGPDIIQKYLKYKKKYEVLKRTLDL